MRFLDLRAIALGAAGLALALLTAGVPAQPPARAPAPTTDPQRLDAPNPALPTIDLQAGMYLIRAEVASDFATRARGLMFRERLAPNAGMIFVFETAQRQCFWMRNTLIPLSAAFIDDDGTIVNIEDMKPLTEDSHCSARPVRFVLEMEQGWFARRGLKPGSRLVQPRLFKGGA